MQLGIVILSSLSALLLQCAGEETLNRTSSSALLQEVRSFMALTEGHAVCPNQNTAGMKMCHGHGDPHYTSRFVPGERHPQGAGSFKIAESKNGGFKVEGFHCPSQIWRFGGGNDANHKFNSVTVAMAIKMSGHVVSVVNNAIYLDGEDVTNQASINTPSGLTIGRNGGWICIASGDKWLDSATKAYVNIHNHPLPPGPTAPNLFNVIIWLSGEQAANKGVCGEPPGTNAVWADTEGSGHSMLPRSVLPGLCKKCMPDPNSCAPLQNAAPSPQQSCEAANPPVPYEKAERVCEPIGHHPQYYRSCIVDYCSEGGDEDAVKDMIESLAQDERLAKAWTAPEDRSAEVLELVQKLEFHIDDVNDEIEKYEAEEKYAELSGKTEDAKMTEEVSNLVEIVNQTHGMITTQNFNLDEIEAAIHERGKKARDEVAVNKQDMHKQIAEHDSQLEVISNTEGEAKKIAETISPELEENRRMFAQSAIEEKTHREVLVQLPMKTMEKDTESNLQTLSSSLTDASNAALANRAAGHERAQESTEEKNEVRKAIQVFHDGIHDGAASIDDDVVHALQELAKLRRLAAMHSTDEHILQSDITNLLTEAHQTAKSDATKMFNAMHDYGTDLNALQKERLKLSRQQSLETGQLKDSVHGVNRKLGGLARSVEDSTHKATPRPLSRALLSSVDSINETLQRNLQELRRAGVAAKGAVDSANAEFKEFHREAEQTKDENQHLLYDINTRLSILNEAVNNAR